MSRIGKNPVTIPEGVNVDISGQDVKVKGPKGELSLTVHDEVSAKLEDNVVVVSPRTGSRLARSLALKRSLGVKLSNTGDRNPPRGRVPPLNCMPKSGARLPGELKSRRRRP